MRYRYASNEHGEIVDAKALDRATWTRGERLACAGCGGDVVPVLGKLKARHFRHIHTAERQCSRETYLHKLAKRIVADSFQSALKDGRPYWLTLQVPRECRHWEKEFGFVCECQPGYRRFDLTRHFDEVSVEAGVEGFVADVLLSSRKTGQKLLVEIAVSHECTPDKIASGLRILELRVDAEDDLTSLTTGLDPTKNAHKCHNFKPQDPLQTSCKGRCEREISAFLVFESGKSKFETGTATYISWVRRSWKGVSHAHIIEDAEHGIVTPYLAAGGYKIEALRALKAGASIKCCALCRYAGTMAIDKNVFCKFRRMEVGHNEAATCQAYRM